MKYLTGCQIKELEWELLGQMLAQDHKSHFEVSQQLPNAAKVEYITSE